MKILSDISYYVKERISSDKISLNDYVTTDNILQNKCGRTFAEKLPPSKCNLTRYKKGDVLVANIRPYLKKVWYADSDGGASADVLVFRAKENISSAFLYSILLQDSFYDYVMKAPKGSKMPRGDQDHIMRFTVLDTDLSEQKRIAKVLTDIDSKIAVNKKINKELEAIAKEMYDYWFVQFDFPSTDGRPYKSSGGKLIFNPILKKEIPEGWEVKYISSIIKGNIGGDWGKEAPEGNYQLKVSCCCGTDIVSMTRLPTRYILNGNSFKLLKEGDMIVEISGGSPTQATGRCVLISKEILSAFDNKLICSNFCQALSIADKDYISYFYHMWKMFYDSDVFFNYEGKTSGIKNFQYDTFVAEKWYFPPKELAIKFGEIVS